MYLIRLLSLLIGLLVANSTLAENRLKEFLKLHNQERESLELTPLEWSEELQKHAQFLTKTMAFVKNYESNNSGYGENSWSGENNGATLEEIFEIWREGKAYFLVDKPVPLNCSENWERCSSYSQIVWSKTTHIGCAAVAAMENDYVVCLYSPAGNVQDQTAY